MPIPLIAHDNPYPIKCVRPDDDASRCEGVGRQPKRHGCGFLVDEATNTAYDCPCRASYSAWRYHHRLGGDIPLMYRDARWASSRLQFVNDRYLNACKAFERDLIGHVERGEGLWIMGAPEHRTRGAYRQRAVARNEIASIIARTAISHARSVAYYTPDALFSSLRQARADGLDMLDALKTIDLLVLANLDWITVPARTFDADTEQDIQHEAQAQGGFPYVFQVGGWAHDQLFDLITTRYDNCKSLIATTRMLGHGQIQDQLGDQLSSRIEASCLAVPLFDWQGDNIDHPVYLETDEPAEPVED